MKGQAALEVRDLSVSYGGVAANSLVSIHVDGGMIVGLIGPNGAGKTTLIDAITGFTRSTGDILLFGSPIGHLPPHRRARLGLARTWQSLEHFNDMTLLENVLVASRPVGLRTVLSDLVGWSGGRDDIAARDALAMVGLLEMASKRPRELSLGQQKLLGIARALGARPRTLLLDEPAAGLDTAEGHALGECLSAIASTGMGILLIDHDMGLVLDACDHIYVMSSGEVIAHGSPAEVRGNERVIEAYLGQTGRDARLLNQEPEEGQGGAAR